jgi:hypothetical protein
MNRGKNTIRVFAALKLTFYINVGKAALVWKFDYFLEVYSNYLLTSDVELHRNSKSKSNSYAAEKELFVYITNKNQFVNAVQENNRCLF